MKYGHSYAFRKVLQKRKQEKAAYLLRQEKKKLAYHSTFSPYLSILFDKWKKEGDEVAKRLYFQAIAMLGSGNKTRGIAKVEAGRKGGLSTKLTKRKQYVTGENHGNHGKVRRKPRVLSDEETLEALNRRIAYYLENPGSYQGLAWTPDWEPPKVPQELPVVDIFGRPLPPILPRRRKAKGIGRDGEISQLS